MTTACPSFGDLLLRYLSKLDRSNAWLADRLGVSDAAVSRWINGLTCPKSADLVQRIADVLGIFNPKEKMEFMTAAGYVVNLFSTGHDDRFAAGDQPAMAAPAPPEDAIETTQPPTASFFWSAALAWAKKMTGWYEISESDKRSWAGDTLHALSTLSGRLTPQGVFIACVAIALWFFTWHLVAPMLRWPLSDPLVRQAACIRYAVACLLLPLVVAPLTSADGEEMLDMRSWRVRLTLLNLKLAGAFTGFAAFAGIGVFAALGWWYLAQKPVVGLGSGILVALPLFFAYVAARRIPLDRLKMFEGNLRMHAADRLVLTVFPFFGPLLALFVFFGQWLLADRFWGPLAILFAVGVIAWMEMQRERKSAEGL